MSTDSETDRRRLLSRVPLALAALAAPPLLAQTTPRPPCDEEKVKRMVSPPEDLMREHGVLKRILLVYDEARWRLASRAELPMESLHAAADILQRFIEQYHEKLEEDHIFPRFRKRKKLVPLVDTLQKQHAAGRKLTVSILAATASAPKDDMAREALSNALAAFVRMYAPHEAREDTVLFPALRSIVSGIEWQAMGEDFERLEKRLFGKEGFEGIVEKVGEIEKKFGLLDLDQYTAKVS